MLGASIPSRYPLEGYREKLLEKRMKAYPNRLCPAIYAAREMRLLKDPRADFPDRPLANRRSGMC